MIFNLKSLQERLKKTRDRDKSKFEFYPKRDWFVLILFFFFFSFVLVFFYRSLFIFKYSDETTKTVVPMNSSELSLDNISNIRLNLILRKWEEKERTFKDMIENRPSFDFLK